MENRPVISISADGPAPGADSEVYKRFQKWGLEVYAPLNLKIPEVLGQDDYEIMRENREYPLRIHLPHYKNIKDWSAYYPSSIGTDISKELKSWHERGISETIWSAAYALIKSFRSNSSSPSWQETTMIDKAPIMYLEAYRTSPEDQEKYYKWFNENVCNILMPLLLKMPGLMGYDWYQDTGLRRVTQDIRESRYPKYLSIIYFENFKAYEDYEKSPELVAVQKSMRSVFTSGLNLKWYVQYQLVKSWRK
jgi:hypothetical protein